MMNKTDQANTEMQLTFQQMRNFEIARRWPPRGERCPVVCPPSGDGGYERLVCSPSGDVYVKARRPRRSGAVLVGVLACFLVGTLLTALTVQSALRGRREARLERQLAQTEWLCEGAVVRAVQALRSSRDYQGETWQPDLKMEPLSNAVVEIKVERSASKGKQSESSNEVASDSDSAWDITITARLDSTSDSDGPMQRSRKLTVTQVTVTETESSQETNTNSEKKE